MFVETRKAFTSAKAFLAKLRLKNSQIEHLHEEMHELAKIAAQCRVQFVEGGLAYALVNLAAAKDEKSDKNERKSKSTTTMKQIIRDQLASLSEASAFATLDESHVQPRLLAAAKPHQ